MVSTIIEQYQFECDGWKRLLTFFQEENIYLQKRLFEVVRGAINDALLQQAECFQTNILEHDITIKGLHQDVRQQEGLLAKFTAHKTLPLSEIMQNQSRLRKEIWKEEWLFTGLQSDFNSCVGGMVLTVEH